jgi:hypothetical protein
MPVSSEYNDYGNIEWDGIADEHRFGLEFILNLMLPAMRDHEQYSRKVLENNKVLTLNELWDSILHGSLDFDPDRELRNEWKQWKEDGCDEDNRPQGFWPSDAITFFPWMCHEWAYQEVLNIHRDLGNTKLTEVLNEHADNYCYTRTDFEAEVKEKGLKCGDDATEEERHAWYKAFSKWQDASRHWVEGEQGGIAQDVRRMIQSGPGRGIADIDQTELIANREAFKARIVETATFCNNLFCIRKLLMPMTTFGSQYDDWDVLPKWTALIASKAEEKRQEREDEGY